MQVRHILDKKRRATRSSEQPNEDDGTEEVPRKMGKRADAYGVYELISCLISANIV
jgi:hypothetical protein